MRKWMRAVGTVLFGLWLAAATGCGGGGSGGGQGGDNAAAGDSPVRQWQLFVADPGHQTIAAFADASLSEGALVSPDLTLVVPALGKPLAYDSGRDILYASRFGHGASAAILVYANASNLDAQSVPTRRITLDASVSLAPALHIDSARDVLYVAVKRKFPGGGQAGGGEVQIFEAASQADGTPAPDRSIRSETDIDAMVVDTTRSLMYVFGANGPLFRWKGIDTDPQPDGRIATDSISNRGLALDVAHDTLFVTKLSGVLVVNAASKSTAADGSITFASRLGTTGPAAYDPARDRLYLTGLDQVFVLDGVSRLSGTTTATALAIDVPFGAEVTAYAFP